MILGATTMPGIPNVISVQHPSTSMQHLTPEPISDMGPRTQSMQTQTLRKSKYKILRHYRLHSYTYLINECELEVLSLYR